ncbi:PKD domain-containing protein [Marinoscillum sp. MHG1-6]|uniref:PKD domain-containing protein n=1 Tax=Marinoscillum sp. MHG1-6 TaxID=2959627 RepID=UPI0021585CDB|nr:PKD domain-containing protein [Marinoscillum sp. MHG1-6]
MKDHRSRSHNLLGRYVLLFMILFSCLLGRSQTGPIEEEVQFSGLVIDLITYAIMPVGGPGPEHTIHPDNRARINMMREVPGSDKIAVIDLNGYLYLMDSQGDLSLYLNFWDHFDDFKDASGKGTGSGAIAFHPEYATNGLFYTAHAEVQDAQVADYSPIEGYSSLQWVLTRWVATDPLAGVFSGTKNELVRLDFTTTIHGMQDITFNPFAQPEDEDYGLLYVCNGEGGGSERGFHNNIGKVESYMGTIWRIDPEGNNSPNGNYGIPETNPYYNTNGAIKEIWAYGFRNPHRLSFEQREGEVILFVGDIGQHNIEEINLVEKGGNYGWDHREGTFRYNWSTRNVEPLPEIDEGGYLYPVAQYDHSEGAAIALGYTWTDASYSNLNGQLLFSDILYGDLFHVPMDSLVQGRQFEIREAKIRIDGSEEGIFKTLAPSSRIDLRFFRDSNGRVWLFTKSNGNIYQVYIPDIEQNVKPIAAFTVNNSSGNAPHEISLDGAESYDFNGDDLTYSWDFGDGTIKEGISVIHTYDKGGEFTVKLTVSDGTESDVATQVIAVNSVPFAAFEISGDSTKVPAAMTFDGGASMDADGDLLNYAWDYGDGSQSFGKVTTHTYQQEGTYDVRLIVYDRRGGDDRVVKQLTIGNVLSASFFGDPSHQIIVYPNPAQDILFIDTDRKLSFEIFNLNGVRLLNGQVSGSEYRVDLGALGPGEYILKLISPQGEFEGQLFIKN